MLLLCFVTLLLLQGGYRRHHAEGETGIAAKANAKKEPKPAPKSRKRLICFCQRAAHLRPFIFSSSQIAQENPLGFSLHPHPPPASLAGGAAEVEFLLLHLPLRRRLSTVTEVATSTFPRIALE